MQIDAMLTSINWTPPIRSTAAHCFAPSSWWRRRTASDGRASTKCCKTQKSDTSTFSYPFWSWITFDLKTCWKIDRWWLACSVIPFGIHDMDSNVKTIYHYIPNSTVHSTKLPLGKPSDPLMTGSRSEDLVSRHLCNTRTIGYVSSQITFTMECRSLWYCFD